MRTELREPKRTHGTDQWPPEVDLILSALEVGAVPQERRRAVRLRYRVRGELRLFSDAPSAEPWIIFTRDVNARGVGFITKHRLPLGYGGRLQIPSPSGQIVTIHCTLYRCRDAAQGWYEGALYFNREQWIFSLQ